jgi:citrate/tricarballylate utilization protein
MDEAYRALRVCNACRYCEGFCAVFPAMELRRDFTPADLTYLANLCHNCRGCYYACQYAPPHPFALNLPRTFTALRAESYARCAWPGALAGLFRRNGTAVSLAAALCIALVLALTAALQDRAVLLGAHEGPGAFYRLIPAWLMIAVAGATFGFSLLAMAVGTVRFWRATGPRPHGGARPALRALGDVLTLRYLGGGGEGCNDLDDAFAQKRRWLHHAVFYGFLLCFASTSVAAFYEHVLGILSPFPFFSPPVLLGTAGGVLLAVGTAGLLWVKAIGDPAPRHPAQTGADVALLLLLLLTSATGLLLLALRATTAMGLLLAVHLGFVLALFLAMPYSKFVHGLYRAAALFQHALEQREAEQGAPRGS